MKVIWDNSENPRLFRWEANSYEPVGSEGSTSAEFVKAAIKADAHLRIIRVTGGGEYWLAKQMNMSARFAELKDAEDERELTPEEIEEKAALKLTWAKIGAIRAFSNDLEKAVDEGRTVDLNTGKIDGSGVGWPDTDPVEDAARSYTQRLADWFTRIRVVSGL